MDLIRTISKSNRRLLIMTIRPNGEKKSFFCLYIFHLSICLYIIMRGDNRLILSIRNKRDRRFLKLAHHKMVPRVHEIRFSFDLFFYFCLGLTTILLEQLKLRFDRPTVQLCLQFSPILLGTASRLRSRQFML